ncbi:CinA family protein [Tsuneonella sp. HG222]
MQADTLSPILPPAVSDRACKVLDLAHEKGVKLATAESCTGGLLAALLTDVRGRGHVFDRGFVTYSLDAKCDILGLDHAEVDACKGVSRNVALQMAAGALHRSQADLAVAITGFAGPGGDEDEEGLVHLCARRRGGPVHHREEHFGPIGRDGVRIASLEAALELLEKGLRE